MERMQSSLGAKRENTLGGQACHANQTYACPRAPQNEEKQSSLRANGKKVMNMSSGVNSLSNFTV